MSIEIQHIHKQFGSFTALHDVNLRWHPRAEDMLWPASDRST